VEHAVTDVCPRNDANKPSLTSGVTPEEEERQEAPSKTRYTENHYFWAQQTFGGRCPRISPVATGLL